MAQPTVARRIDVLEHELGLTLFRRDTRGFTLTEQGETIMAAAEVMETAAATIDQTAQSVRQTLSIRITAFSESVIADVTNILSEFSFKNPNVTFEFLPSLDVLDLTKGEADVGLRISPLEPDPALIAYPVSTAQFAVYAAPSYIERRGKPDSIEQLKQHDILTYRRDGKSNLTHDWVLSHVGQDAIKASFTELLLLDLAIRSGRGVGIKNVRQSRPEVANGTLVQCFEPPKELQAQHQIVFSPDAYRRPEVRAFAKFFVPRYRAMFQ